MSPFSRRLYPQRVFIELASLPWRRSAWLDTAVDRGRAGLDWTRLESVCVAVVGVVDKAAAAHLRDAKSAVTTHGSIIVATSV